MNDGTSHSLLANFNPKCTGCTDGGLVNVYTKFEAILRKYNWM